MKPIISCLCLPLLGLALLAACAAKGGEGGPSAQPKIVVLVDEAQGSGLGKLPSGVVLAFRSTDPKIGLQDQLMAILEEAKPAALVLYPAGAPAALAFSRLKPTYPDTLLYAGLAEDLEDDDNLLLESAADLVAQAQPASEAQALIKGMAELGRRAALGKAKSDNVEEFLAALRATSPGRGWTGAYFRDGDTGVRARNHVIVSPAQASAAATPGTK